MNDSSQVFPSDAAFLQLGDNQTIPAGLDLAIVSPQSTHAQEAVDYILWVNEHRAVHNQPMLHQKIDFEALARISLENDIAAQIQQQEDPSVIDELRKLQVSGDTSRYPYSRQKIEQYRVNIVPRLIFPQTDYVPTDSAVQQYMTGKLDADGFIAALNEAAAR